MEMWDQLATLPLSIDGYALEGLEAEVSSGFPRMTTIVHLSGGGSAGLGEDVVYDSEDHVEFQAAGPQHDFSAVNTLGDFCELIAALDLFPTKQPERGGVSRLYRRWAFDSAGLDLALRQSGLGLPEALGRDTHPLTFAVSVRLGEPPTLEPVTRRLEIDPGLKFKLDPTADWTPGIVDQLAATGAVDSIDFKSFYKGGFAEQQGGVELYELVVPRLPDAWIEDPDLTIPAVDRFLMPHRDRISWDANIHGVTDIEALPFKPRMVNIKPSRLGGLRPLLAAYEYCEANGIGMYSGGQFELGIGREQVQLMASIFHHDSPNDIAPTGWNAPEPVGPLPGSPLPITSLPVGFGVAA